MAIVRSEECLWDSNLRTVFFFRLFIYYFGSIATRYENIKRIVKLHSFGGRWYKKLVVEMIFIINLFLFYFLDKRGTFLMVEVGWHFFSSAGLSIRA